MASGPGWWVAKCTAQGPPAPTLNRHTAAPQQALAARPARLGLQRLLHIRQQVVGHGLVDMQAAHVGRVGQQAVHRRLRVPQAGLQHGAVQLGGGLPRDGLLAGRQRAQRSRGGGGRRRAAAAARGDPGPPCSSGTSGAGWPPEFAPAGTVPAAMPLLLLRRPSLLRRGGSPWWWCGDASNGERWPGAASMRTRLKGGSSPCGTGGGQERAGVAVGPKQYKVQTACCLKAGEGYSGAGQGKAKHAAKRAGQSQAHS